MDSYKICHGDVLGEGLPRRRGLSVSPRIRKRPTINLPLVSRLLQFMPLTEQNTLLQSLNLRATGEVLNVQ